MCKNLMAITGALAILSLGSVVSAQAGGGATSAPSKYNNPMTASAEQARHQAAQAAALPITEFSSSSAKSSVSKR